MASRQRPKIAFALALLLLALSGIAAGFVITRLYRAETLVRHTYDVEVAIGDLESSLTEVGRSRVAYVNSGTPESLQTFSDAVNKVSAALAGIRQLIRDNAAQQALFDRLESNANQRVARSRESVELKQQNRSDAETQLQLTFKVAQTAFDTAAIAQEMRRNEDALLEQRSHLSELLFTIVPAILSISFLLSAWMFWHHYRLLIRELYERSGAENQLRQLSLQLMKVQDEEHRRFARELHDGLGQNLAGAKMIAEALASGKPADPLLAELTALLDDVLSQTRTISHLFHPPFLDEVGFDSAAKWLIEGYEKRMGVTVSANISRPPVRLPRSLELTLYRVLQEALNNIHRHSKSAKADVTVQTDAKWVTLRVRDYGLGISPGTMAAFRANGAQPGVGLTGMKERVAEQGGNLEIRSEPMGTEIIVKLPINAHMESLNPAR
jgi:signal transduction histidine kinase